MQGVISRMAANSSGCKTWCIALVSAIVVILAEQEKPHYVWVSVVPTLLFTFLDAYYLGLEKRFRDKYNAFIQKLHTETIAVEDLFVVTPGKGFKVFLMATGQALLSISVWPFYGLLAGMMFLVRYRLLSTP